MFEKAEKAIAQYLRETLSIPVIIGIPDPVWIEEATPPYGAVYLSSCKPIELITDRIEDDRVDNGNGTYTVTYLDGEALMEFTFEMTSANKKRLDELTIALLRSFAENSFIGEDNEYVLVNIPSFRDELPGTHEERVFIRIFTISIQGPLTHQETLYSVQEVDQDDSFVGFEPLQ